MSGVMLTGRQYKTVIHSSVFQDLLMASFTVLRVSYDDGDDVSSRIYPTSTFASGLELIFFFKLLLHNSSHNELSLDAKTYCRAGPPLAFCICHTATKSSSYFCYNNKC